MQFVIQITLCVITFLMSIPDIETKPEVYRHLETNTNISDINDNENNKSKNNTHDVKIENPGEFLWILHLLLYLATSILIINCCLVMVISWSDSLRNLINNLTMLYNQCLRLCGIRNENNEANVNPNQRDIPLVEVRHL